MLGSLLFILFTNGMWLRIESLIAAYVCNASLLVFIQSQRSGVLESLNKDLRKNYCMVYFMGYKTAI